MIPVGALLHVDDCTNIICSLWLASNSCMCRSQIRVVAVIGGNIGVERRGGKSKAESRLVCALDSADAVLLLHVDVGHDHGSVIDHLLLLHPAAIRIHDEKIH